VNICIYIYKYDIPFDEARMKAYTVKSIVGEIAAKLGCEACKIKMEDRPGEVSEQIRGIAEASLLPRESKSRSDNIATGNSNNGNDSATINNSGNSNRSANITSTSSSINPLPVPSPAIALTMKQMHDLDVLDLGLDPDLSIVDTCRQGAAMLGIGDQCKTCSNLREQMALILKNLGKI
jgi:hypothetical protein